MHASTPRSALAAAASSARGELPAAAAGAVVEAARLRVEMSRPSSSRTVGDVSTSTLKSRSRIIRRTRNTRCGSRCPYDGYVRPHEVQQLRLDREEPVEVERPYPPPRSADPDRPRSLGGVRPVRGRSSAASGAKTMSTPSDASSCSSRPGCAGTPPPGRPSRRSGFTNTETTVMSASSRARWTRSMWPSWSAPIVDSRATRSLPVDRVSRLWPQPDGSQPVDGADHPSIVASGGSRFRRWGSRRRGRDPPVVCTSADRWLPGASTPAWSIQRRRLADDGAGEGCRRRDRLGVGRALRLQMTTGSQPISTRAPARSAGRAQGGDRGVRVAQGAQIIEVPVNAIADAPRGDGASLRGAGASTSMLHAGSVQRAALPPRPTSARPDTRPGSSSCGTATTTSSLRATTSSGLRHWRTREDRLRPLRVGPEGDPGQGVPRTG